ncbi:LysR family transcriptional regulator [Arenicella sp. 4NH20-0111]|uniref:LysR family transcriptional regulator n=1 Tax=Arenicella sp. 4NH20-0111 TaxID=3127648 RepID=UPI0031093FD0
MIDDLKSIAIFVEAIRQGSFRGASRTLGLSPPSISYNIAQLEKKLETPLIYRTTRSLSLTDAGESLYIHGSEMLASCEKGLNKILPAEGKLKGKLTLSITSALIESDFNNKLCDFQRRHPDVALDINYTDEQENLVDRQVDLAIRAGKLEDSTLVCKRLGDIERVLVCSPSYLALKRTNTAPQNPKQLQNWDWIPLTMMNKERRFSQASGDTQQVIIHGKITVNSVVGMTQLCKAGAGLATPPESMVRSAIAQGVLVEPLKDWVVDPIPYYAIWPNTPTPNRLTLRFIAFLELDHAMNQ